ncbi:MAG: sodium:proton exchanger [Deltaproteobacteria bacterium]|nr:MAG: sodium:proton exchanger [Deltaproteobacteria bacterium]
MALGRIKGSLGSRPAHVIGCGFLLLGSIVLIPDLSWAGGNGGDAGGSHALLTSISISIIAATVLAYLANLIKQPLLLAYIAAGAAIGPQFGLGLVRSQSDISIISEMGLILLLFMIGLELDLKKIRESGKSLIFTGILQFVICAALGLGFFLLLGFTVGPPYEYRIFGVKVLGGEYDLLYLAVCIALSSTAIVVKLLYEKFELDTLAGRLTLGVLVFQDIWAIVMLSIQPSLANPRLLSLLWNFAEGLLLVLLSLVLSKYLLGYIFRKIAKLPELVLVASLAWCFFICGVAGYLNLSLEMGALIAGASISTFPYNAEIIAKIISIRDFFITLFFVGLGMTIPNPLDNLGMFAVAGVAALFVIATRFFSVFPILYLLKNGHRVSLLTSINLSQISEFALVITALGIKYQHIVPDIQTLIIYIFVITSVSSTYMIKSSHLLQTWMSNVLQRLGVKDIHGGYQEEISDTPKDIAVLGLYRIGSAFIKEIEELNPDLLKKLLVVDYNPVVYQKLQKLGVKVVYGDISHLETLHHAGLEDAKLVLSTIPDDILVGTDNLKLMKLAKNLSPKAKIILTAVSPAEALKMYREGADYVLLPNMLAGSHLVPVVEELLRHGVPGPKERAIQALEGRAEILG